MGLLGGALGAIGKGLAGGGGGLLKNVLGGIGGGQGGEGGGAAGGLGQGLQKALEAVGGIKGLIDQVKGLAEGGGQAEEAQQAEGQEQQESPLMRLAKMILEADPKDLEKVLGDLKAKAPKELGPIIDKLAEAKMQMPQQAA